MARHFAGEDIRLGSDASIDSTGTFGTQRTIACHVLLDSTGGFKTICAKDRAIAAWAWQIGSSGGSFPYTPLYEQDYSTGTPFFNAQVTEIDAGRVYHLVLSYNAISTGADPEMWINGTSEPVAASTVGGTITEDSAADLILGRFGNNNRAMQGAIGFFCYDNSTWGYDRINRHRWWGRAGGGPSPVIHPFLTDKLTNEGTATADGTATGTDVRSMSAPVMRPGTAMMGMGVGW